MIRIIHTTALTFTGLVLAFTNLVLGSDSAGARAQHGVFEESYDGSFHLSADDNPCGRWAGTIREVRSGSVKIVAAPGGQTPEEYHINGAIDASIEIVPDDPQLPSYAGAYREKLNGVITGADGDGDDVTRVAQYRLRAPMTGTDGSRLLLTLSGKVTLNASGRMVVGRDSMTCA